jgi:hypothetical protein
MCQRLCAVPSTHTGTVKQVLQLHWHKLLKVHWHKYYWYIGTSNTGTLAQILQLHWHKYNRYICTRVTGTLAQVLLKQWPPTGSGTTITGTVVQVPYEVLLERSVMNVPEVVCSTINSHRYSGTSTTYTL